MIPMQLQFGFDAAVIRRGLPIQAWSGADVPSIRANSLRAAFSYAQPGNLILSGAGDFQFGQKEKILLPSCQIVGMGRGVTRWLGSARIDADGTIPVGPTWALQNTRLRGLSLISKCYDPAEDGGCLGFDRSGSYVAEVDDCELWCPEWTFYSWTPGNAVTIRRSTITTGCVGIAAEDSGLGQTIRVWQSEIIGDASLSNCSTGNAVRDPVSGGVFGAVCRGGLADFRDVDFTIKGQAVPPRACAITDHGGRGDVPAGNTVIQLFNCRSNVIANGATSAADLDISQPYVTVREDFCRGGATDGSFSRTSAAPVAQPGA